MPHKKICITVRRGYAPTFVIALQADDYRFDLDTRPANLRHRICNLSLHRGPSAYTCSREAKAPVSRERSTWASANYSGGPGLRGMMLSTPHWDIETASNLIPPENVVILSISAGVVLGV